MKTINFNVQNKNGEAVIVDSYNEGTIYVENNLPGELGTLKTNKIGIFDGYAIYENYYDIYNNDDSYFAVKIPQFTYYDSAAGQQKEQFSSLSSIVKHIEEFPVNGDSEGAILQDGEPILEYRSIGGELIWSKI